MNAMGRVYVTNSRISDFNPRARVGNGEDVWFSPDGDLQIVLTAEQWNAAIAVIKSVIAEREAAEVPA